MRNSFIYLYIGCVHDFEASKYNLSGYLTLGSKSVIISNGKRFAIQRYQGVHEDEFTVMEVDEYEQENGVAQLFKNGVLQLSWRMVNGQRKGNLTIY